MFPHEPLGPNDPDEMKKFAAARQFQEKLEQLKPSDLLRAPSETVSSLVPLDTVLELPPDVASRLMAERTAQEFHQILAEVNDWPTDRLLPVRLRPKVGDAAAARAHWQDQLGERAFGRSSVYVAELRYFALLPTDPQFDFEANARQVEAKAARVQAFYRSLHALEIQWARTAWRLSTTPFDGLVVRIEHPTWLTRTEHYTADLPKRTFEVRARDLLTSINETLVPDSQTILTDEQQRLPLRHRIVHQSLSELEYMLDHCESLKVMHDLFAYRSVPIGSQLPVAALRRLPKPRLLRQFYRVIERAGFEVIDS